LCLTDIVHYVLSVTVSLGAHIGQQGFAMDEMRSVWRWLDENGFDWISAWDHIYEAPNEGGVTPHFEAVATLAALACDTTNARLGCLVFYVGYRNPGLLAKAAVTIDHLSNGRFELGLGGGWHEWEAEAYGYDFPGVAVRLDMLEEAVELVSALNRAGWDDGEDSKASDGTDPKRVTFRGDHFRLNNASFLPPASQGPLPIWIGGVGRNRTLPMAARWADGWNAAYISADVFADLNRHLDSLCEGIGRDPGEIERSVNLLFGMGLDEADAKSAELRTMERWGAMAERVRGGALLGTPEQAVEHLMAYRDAGADLINIALRQPIHHEVLEAYREVVMPAVRSHAA
jgi:alkanesulfonate monooxygenase SsuD/methylene tetrahydromethanopterin reductase-like flavin-dependent oxidoreductase (luciferase family)